MKNGQLQRMMRYPDINMKDSVKSRSNTEGAETFVWGSRKIDGSWVNTGVDISDVCFLLFYFEVGDHVVILLDIPQHSLIGRTAHKITRPTARRLQ